MRECPIARNQALEDAALLVDFFEPMTVERYGFDGESSYWEGTETDWEATKEAIAKGIRAMKSPILEPPDPDEDEDGPIPGEENGSKA